MSIENEIDMVKDRCDRDLITTEQANIEIVKIKRFILVKQLPRDIRNTYNKAVKNGELAHIKKDGRKPEAYYHPTFKYLAIDARNKEELRIINSLKAICV